MSQIFAIFAICLEFAKICTHEIFVSRVYPQQINVLSVEMGCQRELGDCTVDCIAKQRALIGRYAIDWEQRNCHASHSSTTRTRGFTPLLCSTRGSLSLLCSGKSDSLWHKNCTGKSQPCRSLDLKFYKLSALPLASSHRCKSGEGASQLVLAH